MVEIGEATLEGRDVEDYLGQRTVGEKDAIFRVEYYDSRSDYSLNEGHERGEGSIHILAGSFAEAEAKFWGSQDDNYDDVDPPLFVQQIVLVERHPVG